MHRPQVSHPQRGFIRYVVLALVLVVAAGAIAFLQSKKPAPSPNALTASLVGTGGVTITAPDSNSTGTSPVHVAAYVAAGFAGPVRTMQVYADGALAYQIAGTSVDTSLTLSASATHNITVEALKKNNQLEGSATVYVTVVNPTATPSPTPTPTLIPAPPSASSVPPLPPVPSP